MRRELPLFILTFLIVATAWNILVPPYENLDEIEHAEVVRHIAVTGRLPIHGQAQAAGYHVRQEASQPPFYHVLAAAWLRLWGLPTAPHAPQAVPGHVVECGPTGTFYNKATWIRTPAQEWRGSLLTLHALRFFSTLLQTMTVAGAWTLARRASRHPWLARLTTALVAFNPQFLLVASGVNNDNAVTPLATWGLVLACDLWDKGPTYRRVVLFGLIGGLAALSKLSGLAVIGLGGLALLLHAWQHPMSLRRLCGWGCLLVLPALILIAPWMVRNLHLYGDPTALAPMLEEVGRRTYPIAFGEAVPMFLSYWGQMPCAFYPRAVYWPYGLVMAGGLFGVVAGWRRFGRQSQMALTLSAVWFVVIVLAWLRWNSLTPATGGRLLFPAIAALALILAAGWEALLPQAKSAPARVWTATLPVWAVVTLVAGPGLIFARPAQHPVTAAIPNPTNATFGEAIVLRGYQARITQARLACIFASAAYCRPALEVTLYWQATQPLSQNLTLALQLVSPVPGETDLRLNYHHWPAHGNWATSLWSPGTIWRDRALLPIPDGDAPTQAWALQIALLDDASKTRLPVSLNGAPLGDMIRLTRLRVPGRPTDAPAWNNPATPAHFGEAIRLADAQVVTSPDEWRVSLLWECQTALPEDYTVFVHAYAATGELLTTGDSPPQNDHFPTSLWQPGDRLLDIHTLTIPPASTPTRVAVGLYHPITGERLRATFNGTPLADHAVIIWQATP